MLNTATFFFAQVVTVHPFFTELYYRRLVQTQHRTCFRIPSPVTYYTTAIYSKFTTGMPLLADAGLQQRHVPPPVKLRRRAAAQSAGGYMSAASFQMVINNWKKCVLYNWKRRDMSAFGKRPQAFVLHGFQPPPPPSGDFVASAVSKIVTAIEAIFGSKASDLSYQELHCATYNMVIQRQGEILYNSVCQAFKAQARSVAARLDSCPDAQLLLIYIESWRSYSFALHIICSFLMYMDHNYCSVLKKPSLHRVGINAFLERACEPGP